MAVVDVNRIERVRIAICNDALLHHAVLAPTIRRLADGLDRYLKTEAICRGRAVSVDAAVLDALIRDGDIPIETTENAAIARTTWTTAALRIIAYDRRHGETLLGANWRSMETAMLSERLTDVFFEEYRAHRHHGVDADPAAIHDLISAENLDRVALLRRADIHLRLAVSPERLYAIYRGTVESGTVLMLGDDPNDLVATAARRHFQPELALVGAEPAKTSRRLWPRLVVDNGVAADVISHPAGNDADDDDGPVPA